MAEIDLQPTEAMASNAARGLELRKKHGKGGTAIGVARARDISNRKHLSPETVRRMHAFFNRHEKNKSGGEDDAGYIAWLLWGGDSGKTWAASKFKQLDKDKNAKGNPRMERSDQLAEMLMKPVTLTNHKQMEKVVDAAIAHAKRVGDADLLELAEETGHEILALRSRAARPGEKASMALAMKLTPEQKKFYYELWNFWTPERQKNPTEHEAELRALVRRAKSMPDFRVTAAGQRMPNLHELADEQEDRVKSYSSRPGTKAAMGRILHSHEVDELKEFLDAYGVKDYDIIKSIGQVKVPKSQVGKALDAISSLNREIRKEGIGGSVAVDVVPFSRPGAKAKMAADTSREAAQRVSAELKALMPIAKKIQTTREVLRETEKQGKWRDCIGTAQSLSIQYSQLANQYMRVAAAIENERAALGFSRPGAKAVFVRLPDDYARNFQYMKELMGDITRAFKDTDHISLKEAAHDFLGFAKKIREEAFSDAADMKKHPQDWNARPGAKVANALSDACWEGYEAVGTKQKDGKTVPNCVPMAKQEESEEVRSGLKMIAAKDQAVADKIRTLIGEGKDQKQAVAIALDLKRRGEI